MGKKSLLASTAKKKTTTRKKTASKKSAKASSTQKGAAKKAMTAKTKKSVSKKSSAGGSSVTKKSSASRARKTVAAKTKSKAPSKAIKTPRGKTKAKAAVKQKTPAPRAKKLTLKALLLKQFTIGTGKKAAKPITVKKKAIRLPEAPAFVSGYGKKETERIRGLLFRHFDLKEPKPAKKAAIKKRKVSIKEILHRRFDLGRPLSPVAINKRTLQIPQAPPFVSGYDKKDTEKIRALLFKAFYLKEKSPVQDAEEGYAESISSVSEQSDVPLGQSAPAVHEAARKSNTNITKLGLCALALLVAIIVGTSFANRNKFYLKEVNGGLEVWRGKFAPAGTELVYKLNGAKAPNPHQDSYSKQEVRPILFGCFLDEADTLLDAPGGPDIAKIKVQLKQAATFAPTRELYGKVQRRLNGIDFMVAFHKADVALSKGSPPDLRMAKAWLTRAYASASTEAQREFVAKTQMAVDEAMAGMKTQ